MKQTKLKIALAQKRMTVKELARKTNMSLNRMYRKMNEGVITLDEAYWICKVLDVENPFDLFVINGKDNLK